MAMLGFFTFGSMLAFLDLAAKNQIEAQDKDEFPKELKGTKGKIWLYKNHNPGLSFGVLKECPKAMELVPLCITSAQKTGSRRTERKHYVKEFRRNEKNKRPPVL